MDNYKINAKDAVESLEIQGLFEQLGYMRAWDKNKVCFEPNHIFAKDGVLTWLHNDPILFEKHVGKELTLPQLRDLVVLKRNDVKDATHTHKNFEQARSIILSATNEVCDWVEGKWKITCRQVSELIPISNQDPSLISGADALRALADGKEVEFKHDSQGWVTCLGLNIERVLGGLHQLRLKPQTIKVKLELPKPFEPNAGDMVWCLTEFSPNGYEARTAYEPDDFVSNLGYWRTEDEIKQVVEQLRKIRGTNS